MRLSIVIPLYNSGHFLPTCLDSLLDQDLGQDDYEIIIINDGSKDNSLDIALEYEKKYAYIKVHTKNNGGVGSARNMGLSKAKGEFIYFIDPDDFLLPNVLKTIVDTASVNSLDILTFISKQTKDSDTDREISNNESAKISEVKTGIDYVAQYRFQNEVWWYIIRRSFIEEVNIKFIEDRWMEDAIITAQLFVAAKRMANLSLDTHRYVIVKGSAMKNREPEHYLKIIDDNRNAALVFEAIINDLESQNVNSNSIKRLRTRQQSFVFFMMVRILRSTISLDEVKQIIEELAATGAYPMTNFVGRDYKGIDYSFLTYLFNKKSIFYILFRIFNPLLR